MFQLILKLICVIIILCGIILIYDARTITKKFFGFGDQNEGSNGLKMIGFILCIIGALIILFTNWPG